MSIREGVPVTRNGRIVLAAVMATVVLLAVVITYVLVRVPPPTTAATTPAGSSAPDPTITSFHVISEIDCPGGTANVPAAWITKGATAVSFDVDAVVVPGGPGFPVSGTASLPVSCDGKAHAVTLTASAGGVSVKRTVHVNTTLPTPPPPGAPTITAFQILESVTCTAGQPLTVAAAWASQDATTVSFAVDGQPLPAAAGYPVTGAGQIPVPCDGEDHAVTLTVANAAAQTDALTRTVNTTVAVTPPPQTVTTTVTLPPTTVTGVPTEPTTPVTTTAVDPPATATAVVPPDTTPDAGATDPTDPDGDGRPG